MDNIAILDNPYSEGVVISFRGVGIDSKAAKLNNNTKKPALEKKWDEGKLKLMSDQLVNNTPKNYDDVLKDKQMTAVNYANEVKLESEKKIRTNEVVPNKLRLINNNCTKIDVIPLPEKESVINASTPEVMPMSSQTIAKEAEKPVMQEKPIITIEPTVLSSRSDIHGRHEHTGEIPVEAIREAVRNNNPSFNNGLTSRMERNVVEPAREEKQETNAVDMDLYTSLMQNTQDDVSKQLQGARKELSMEKEEGRKLAEQYGEAVKELEKLKEEIENKKRIKEQHEKQELSSTLNDLETIKRENLEKNSDLSAIRAEISRLEAQKRAMEENYYDDYRSFGRAA